MSTGKAWCVTWEPRDGTHATKAEAYWADSAHAAAQKWAINHAPGDAHVLTVYELPPEAKHVFKIERKAMVVPA